MQGLVDRCFGVKGESSVNLSRHFSGNNSQDFLAELYQQPVEGGIDLVIQILALSSISFIRALPQDLTWPLPYSTALSISFAYSGFLEAARMREGLVVASCGLYLSMADKVSESPVVSNGVLTREITRVADNSLQRISASDMYIDIGSLSRAVPTDLPFQWL